MCAVNFVINSVRSVSVASQSSEGLAAVGLHLAKLSKISAGLSCLTHMRVANLSCLVFGCEHLLWLLGCISSLGTKVLYFWSHRQFLPPLSISVRYFLMFG